MIESLTAILVLVTGFYAWVTYRILKANERVVDVMREQADAMARPYISIGVFVEPDNPVFYLRVQNVGKSAALDLRLTMDRSFYKFGERSPERDLASFAAFNEPIASLPPGGTLVFSLAQGFVVFAKDADPDVCPKLVHIAATYSFDHRKFSEEHIVDLRPYIGSDIPQDPVIRKLGDLNKEISKLRQAIKVPS